MKIYKFEKLNEGKLIIDKLEFENDYSAKEHAISILNSNESLSQVIITNTSDPKYRQIVDRL